MTTIREKYQELLTLYGDQRNLWKIPEEEIQAAIAFKLLHLTHELMRRLVAAEACIHLCSGVGIVLTINDTHTLCKNAIATITADYKEGE